MACSVDGTSFLVADDARLHRGYHVVRVAYADRLVSSVLPNAQPLFAEGNRLAGSVAHLCDDALAVVHLGLWRLLQMVRLSAYKNGGRIHAYLCWVDSLPTDSQSLPIRRVEYVEMPQRDNDEYWHHIAAFQQLQFDVWIAIVNQSVEGKSSKD